MPILLIFSDLDREPQASEVGDYGCCVFAAQTAELFVPPAQERSTAFQAGSFFFLVQMIAHDGLFSKDGSRAGNLQGSERKPLQIFTNFTDPGLSYRHKINLTT